MDNIHDPDFKRHVFDKRDSINEHISVYSGIRNQFGIISRYIYLTLDNGDIIGSFGIEGGGENINLIVVKPMICTYQLMIIIKDMVSQRL